METLWLLAARYDGAVFIPVDLVCRDFFQHLSVPEFMRKVGNGDITLPVLRMDPNSAKTTKGVHLHDLAEWIDHQREIARNEAYALTQAAHLRPSSSKPVQSLGQTDRSYQATLRKWENSKAGK